MKETKGTKLSDYKLSVKVPDREGFGHAEKKQYFSLADLRSGDYAGMTETDSKTSGKEDGQYTLINKKSGNSVSAPGKSVGLTVKLDKHARIG